jgi:hypothetical protein
MPAEDEFGAIFDFRENWVLFLEVWHQSKSGLSAAKFIIETKVRKWTFDIVTRSQPYVILI